jgi:hypothetical protein
VNLDDTARCPVASECATCAGTKDLAVVTVETPVGVLCCTLCVICGDDGERLPVLSWSGAVGASLQHCQHLGIDADQMAAAIAGRD